MDMEEQYWQENTIAFCPFNDYCEGEGLLDLSLLYKQMIDLFEKEISPVIDESLSKSLAGESETEDVINDIAGNLVNLDIERYILHGYLNIYNEFLRAVDSYANKCSLGGLFKMYGFEPRSLYLYWYPYYTRGYRNGYKPQYRPKTMIQVLSVSFVIANELMCLCQYTRRSWDVLKYAYRGSKRLLLTWADYFNYIYATHSSVSSTIIYNVISLILRGGRGIVNTRNLSRIEKEGIAFADYAYGRKNGVRSNLKISSLIFGNADLISLYDTRTLFLKLEDAFGLQVAAFEYNNLQCASFAGTRMDFTGVNKGIVSMQNILTDIIQIAYKPTPVYMAAAGIVDAILESNDNHHLHVFGHSLGGGLTQFACAANSTTRVHGYGYNSAGLSAATCDILSKHGTYVSLNNIVFVNASTDVVSKIGTFLGERVLVDTTGINALEAHKIETLNRKINNPRLYC